MPDGTVTGRYRQERGVKLYTAAQMRAADAAALEAGVSGERLMEAAGRAVAERLLTLYPGVGRVLVLCGKGNNGGDGYVAARALGGAVPEVTVLELEGGPTSDDARRARTALVATGTEPARLTRDALTAWLVRAPGAPSVVVDALLGCGLDRPLADALADVVEAVNGAREAAIPSPVGLRVLAVDVPTGVAADSPALLGPHLRADTTVQLAGPKVASAFHPARAAYGSDSPGGSRGRGVGDLGDTVGDSVVAIGIPADILDSLSLVTLLTPGDRLVRPPGRQATVHKYTAGTVTIVAGSPTYAGAAELACRGAWRGGAGLVTLVSDVGHPAAWPETIRRPLGDEWPPKGLDPKAAAAVVAGPGLEKAAPALLAQVLDWAPGPVVFDAAALAPDVLWPALELRRPKRTGVERAAPTTPARPTPPAGARLCLTPHAGEAARLLATTATAVEADPLGAARDLCGRFDAVVVLKGASTVVAAPDGRSAVSTRGHPGMATGGTGDVLAGLIGALAAAPGTATGAASAAGTARVVVANAPRPVPVDAAPPADDLFRRACVAVLAHGIAGERAAAGHGVGLVASDLVAELAGVLADLAALPLTP